MIIPILEAQASSKAFEMVPVLSEFSGFFSDVSISDRLKSVAMILAIVVVARGIFQLIVLYLAAYLPNELIRRITYENFEKTLQMNMLYVEAKEFGVLHQNVFGFPGRISMLLTALAAIISNGILLAIYISLMLLLSVELTLMVIIFSVLFSVVYMSFSSKPLRKIGAAVTEANADLHQAGKDAFTGMRHVHLCGGEEIISEKFSNALNKLMRSLRKSILINAIPQPLLMAFSGLFVSILLFMISLDEARIAEQVTQLLVFLVILMRLIGPVGAINQSRGRIRSQLHALNQQEKFSGEFESHRAPAGGKSITGFESSVEFDDVTFRYSTRSGPSLVSLNATINRGEMIALVGASGAGKSTFVNLLVRFDDPQSGKIKVDGTDMRDIDPVAWRKLVSVVSQDVFLLNASIADNLRFGLENISMNQIEKACEIAAADKFIMDLPKGFETLVGERGTQLSGGQRQRLAIARAVIADPQFLILDEATSHLDSQTELAIQVAIEHLRKERTLLVIAHRMSTIRRADRIIVLDEGKLAETGKHEDLVDLRGKYWQLLAKHQPELVASE